MASDPGTSARGHVPVVQIVQYFDRLQFNHKHVFDQQVGEVLANDQVIVIHFDATFICERILIDLFQEPDTKCIEHGERAADHTPRQIIHPVTICIANLANHRGPRLFSDALPVTRCFA
jgi:hypothetical protein